MRTRVSASIFFVALLTNAAWGQYSTLIPFSNVRVGNNYEYQSAIAFEGLDTAYAVNRDVEFTATPYAESQIIRIDNIRTDPTPTVLVTYQQWCDFLGVEPESQTLIGAGSRMKIIGDYLQFLDNTTDQIYRVHKVTGELSVFVSKDDVMAVTGFGNVNLLDECAFAPDDRMAFYDQTSKHLLEVDAEGNVSILIARMEFAAYYASIGSPEPINGISGGISYDQDGNLYWALSNSGFAPINAGGAIYRRDAVDGVITQLVDELDVWLASDSFGSVAFNDIIAGPDCHVYLFNREAAARHILAFDVTNPKLTLAQFLSQMDLATGDMGTFPAYVGQFEIYDKDLVFTSGGLSKISNSIYHTRLIGFPLVRADFDNNGAVDNDDVLQMLSCRTGPMVPYDVEALPEGCTLTPDCFGILPADLDRDGDVDQDDFGYLQRCYGPDPDPGCAD
jgi:hypothetical protein